MATENHSPTNESSGSAIPANSGAEIGGALSENELANYLNTQTETIPKAFEGKRGGEKGKMLPNPFEPQAEQQSADNGEPEVNTESDSSEDELDLDLIDGDSENTKDEETNDSEDEPSFEITVDGKKFEVKQSELIASYQKQESASNKFRDAEKLHISASEMRKEAEEVKATYAQEREALKSVLTQYQNFIESSYKEQQPDWNALLEQNPAEYIRQKEYWQAREYQLAQAKAYREQLTKQEEAERKQAEEKHLSAQRDKVFELFPQWKNKDVAQRDAKQIQDYLANEGFSPQEQDGLNDARMLAVVHKAALYDKLVKANAQKKQQAAKPSGKTLNAGTATVGGPDFAARQAQTKAAREQKAINDSLRVDPSRKNFETYLANQWAKKK
ncbi:hypothetical protein ACAX43_12445 [Paraburkholderia sp. IW21]|uniref:hypothetical protein n=1 Tax=Paraburkholderia sp. IW21 TaxID=3242488 RepID=UPI00351F992D